MGDESLHFLEERFKGPDARQQGGLLTLLFTDLVGSTALKERLGDRVGVALIQEHHAAVRRLLKHFPGGREIETAGDSFLLVFATPSEAVRFALVLQKSLCEFNQARAEPVQDRIGLHMGEVVIEERDGKRDIHGMQVDTCARVMSLAQAGQILLTRPVFDNARQSLKGEEIEGVGALEWLNHGRFELKGVGEPIEVCEVRGAGSSALSPPTTSEKARRVEAAEGEAVLGWRPAVSTLVPNTKWMLEQKLGEGGFGEVWLGRHQAMKERRVFKFCFRADRVRSLKREMTLFRLIKERIGDHPNIVSLREVYFDQPPFYVEEDYVEGQDLASWCATRGGADKVPLETRLEMVAQVADALQAAHDAGVIHRDVKPGNILVSNSKPAPSTGAAQPSLNSQPLVKLTDFGIGQVISEEALSGVTKAGFTQTLISPSSSHTGTQMYMAPELLAGKPATTRSDIYSLAVVLFQLLVADFRRPVATDWAEEIADPLLQDDLRSCFAGNPAHRIAAANLLAQNLRSLGQRRLERAKREAEVKHTARRRLTLRVLAGAATLLSMLAGVLFYGLRRAQVETLKARRIAYASDMNVAWGALRDNNLDQVTSLLEAQIPRPGQQDLRHWEWRYLWQQCRGEQLWKIGPIANSAMGLALLPGDRLAIAGGGAIGPGGRVHLWDLTRQRILRTSKFRGNIGNIAASADGRQMAVTTWDPVVRLLDPDTLEVAAEIHHTNAIWSIAISPKGDLLSAVGRQDISVWDLATLRLLWATETPNNLSEASFLPDGESLVVPRYAGDVCARVAARDGKVIWQHRGPTPSCSTVSPDGKLVAWGGWSGGLGLIDTFTGEGRPLTNYSQVITALALSTDNQQLAISGSDRVIRLWDLKTGRETRSLRGHTKQIATMQFSPDDHRLYTASEDGTVRGWDVQPSTPDGDDSGSNITGQDAVGQFGARPISRDARLMLTSPTNQVRRLLNMESFCEIGTAHLPTNGRALALSLDGRYAAAGGKDGHVTVWDCKEGKLSWSFTAHSNQVDALEFSPKADRLATVASSSEVRVWKYGAAAPETSRVLGPPGNSASDMAFTPDGNTLVLHAYGNLHVLAVKPGSVDRRIACDVMFCVDISRDGSMVAAGGHGQVLVWYLEPLRLAASLRGSLGSFTSTLSFSPDGRRLAASDYNSITWVWDLATTREVARFGPTYVGYAHFQPDGNTLVLSHFSKPNPLRARTWAGLSFLRAPTWGEIDQALQADAAAGQLWLEQGADPSSGN